MGKTNFSKVVVSLVVLLNVVFTVAILYIFFRIGNEPTSLVVAWFAFTTGELWMLASIKKSNKKGENFNVESGKQGDKSNGTTERP